ncbi:MAG: hypothetical protein HRU28_08520 [Rhizobiales bacterium]|nr:hypothetical protein [Hyphomicrobiales bacterium]
MTILSFTKEFALAVENRTKWQTIRNGKHQFKVGEKLQLYKGRYAPGERIKMHDAVCLSVEPIDTCFAIDKDGIFCDHVFISGVELNRAEKDRLAKADGFKTYLDFAKYFLNSKASLYPNYLIKWGVAFNNLVIGNFYLDGRGELFKVTEKRNKHEWFAQKIGTSKLENDGYIYNYFFSGARVTNILKAELELKWQVAP